MCRISKLQYVALTFLTLTPAVLMIMMWGSHIPSDPFVFVMLCALTVGLWCPLGFYVSELVNNVDGWNYEAGTYDKWVWYNDSCIHVLVERRKNTNSYWVALLVDDEDYFGDECITIVSEYKDYGSLITVLADAERVAVDLLVGASKEPF